MKRVVSSSLLLLFVLIAIAAGLFYFQKYYGITGGKAVNAIPADAAYFFEADLSSGVVHGLTNTPYWKDLQDNNFFKKINAALISFDSISNSENDLKDLFAKEKLIISTHVVKANEFDFLFLINLPVPNQESFADEMVRKLTGATADATTRSYEDVDIKELVLNNGSNFTYAISKNIFIGSMTAFLVEDAIRQQKASGKSFTRDKIFSAIYDKTKEIKSNNFFISYRNLPGWLSVFKNINNQESLDAIDNFANWSVLNPVINDNEIFAEGNTYANDSTSYAFHLLAQQPVNFKVFKILPGKTAAVMVTGITDKNNYFKSFKKYLSSADNAAENNQLLEKIKSKYKFSAEEKFYEITGNEFALAVTEPSSINYENNSYFILKVNDAVNAKKILQTLSFIVDKKQNEKTMQEKYNGYSIGFIRLQGVISALYGDAFKKVNKMYYTFIGDYVVFANQATSLRTFIDYQQTDNLLINNETFKSVSAKFDLRANYFLYCKNPLNNYITKSALSALWDQRIDSAKNYLNKWDAFAFSLASKNKNLSTTSLLRYNSKNIASEVSLVWATQLDTAVSMKPQVVNDLAGKNRFIMVQDDANMLYQLSNSGTIVWKKQLDEKIMGDFYAIDLYKNSTTEIIFNTRNYIYMIDMNGDNVSNYPIHMPAEATNGLAVFDPDSLRDYRIYIACSNAKIYGYEGSGKPLAGWNFTNDSGIINMPLQLFTVNAKKFLVTSDNLGSVFFLDKRGINFVNLKEKVFRKSNVRFYLNESPKDNFSLITLDTTANIVSISMDGKVTTQSNDSLLNATNFIYVESSIDSLPHYFFTKNDLFGGFTDVDNFSFSVSLNGAAADGIEKYFLDENKSAIGLNAAASNKLFLFNTNATLFKGFPVKGSTPFVIDKLNKEGKNYLIAGSVDGNIYVYSLE